MDAITVRNWKELITPKSVEVDRETETLSYAKFVVEPLERGFGITLGNALRRILLSSIQGAAITAVQIEDVLHEFSTIPGVVEDVTDIILNLKRVRVRMDEEGPKTLTLKASGKGIVRASDFEIPEGVRLLNPNQPIATLHREGKLHLRATVDIGRGFVPAERNKDENAPIGTIPIDAVFSPIRKVNFSVTHARVGQITDYDKLTIEITTDAEGGITPRDALAYAAKILKEQLTVFINFDEDAELQSYMQSEESAEANENLQRSIEELDLSVRSYNCLKNAGIRTVSDLVQKTESEMLRTKNFGRKSLNEIREILSGMGLALGMKLRNRESESQALQEIPREKEAETLEGEALEGRNGIHDETP